MNVETTDTDNIVKISQKENIYTLTFNRSEYNIINSVLKPRLIRGASTNDSYTSIVFNAKSVKTLEQHRRDNLEKYGNKQMLISDVAQMLTTLSTQLSYLINKEGCSFLGYNTSDILVINDNIYIYTLSTYLLQIDSHSKLISISRPFSHMDALFSPEVLKITELPSYVHYKTVYFSLGLLMLNMLLQCNNYYLDYLQHSDVSILISAIDNHPIKYTKLYWCILRCLELRPEDRYILYL